MDVLSHIKCTSYRGFSQFDKLKRKEVPLVLLMLYPLVPQLYCVSQEHEKD